ncbi:TauD/TfdA family dioxygenase [Desmospora activa]|uniref:L-asparagine oxygenase n=1 Tax=Desmospora activa DSM 45169 TaxID=1121389 RepID=A0A2T4ZAW3_9BACL|nr:TauD/TfdA family dioxygenase [Desmospora activa]PTM59016.1 L-asparagine oxygenase [Desmospora activa DSM 45169]
MADQILYRKAEEVSGLQNYIVSLTEEEKEAVARIIESLPALDVRRMENETLTQIQVAAQQLPSRLVEHLVRFRREPNRYGVIMFRNLPTDAELPATPADGGFPADKSTFVSEYCLLQFLLFLGEPIAYEDEKAGLLIQNVCPVKGQEKRQENTSSNHLNYHTEDGFHPYQPDYLSLIGLRADHDRVAQTLTASVREVLHTIPSTALTLLRQPLYRLSPSSSFNITGEDYSVVLPVLSGSLLEPQMCVHFSSMEAVNREAKWALDTLRNALLHVGIGFQLNPGDLLIMDNRLVAHARTTFTPRYDGKDRWLQRMFTVVDFHRSSFSRGQGGYVCSPLYVESIKNGNSTSLQASKPVVID